MSSESDRERCIMLVQAQNRLLAKPRHQLEVVKKELECYPMDMTEETYAELKAQKKALEERLEEIRQMSPAQILTLEEYQQYLSL